MYGLSKYLVTLEFTRQLLGEELIGKLNPDSEEVGNFIHKYIKCMRIKP